METIAKEVFEQYSEESTELRMVLPLRWEELYSSEQESFIKIVDFIIKEYLKQKETKWKNEQF